MTAAEILEVRKNSLYFFQGFGRYRDEQTRAATRSKANVLQRRVFEHYRRCQQLDQPCRMVVCKYRRAGSSTAGACLTYIHPMNYHARMGVIGTDYKAASNMLDMVKFYGEHDDFPGWGTRAKVGEERKVGWTEWHKGEDLSSVPWDERVERVIATRIDFGHDSTVELYTSKNPESARSAGLNGYHACVPGDTRVISEDGRVKLIRDVLPGDSILTDSGARTSVVATECKPNAKGSLVRIIPWLSEGVSFTWDHKIPTQRGMLFAKDVREGDEVSMPLRPIIDGDTPPLVIRHSIRRQGGGKARRSAGREIPKTRDTGFFFGYYLAEGHAHRTGGRFTEITFARHRSEARYSDRAVASIAEFAGTPHTIQRENCLTDTVSLRDSGLASLVAEYFGAVAGKHIPDWVFSAGREFCEGLLDGYLSGDGSKTVPTCATNGRLNRIVAVTIHSSIATQIRDLAASLGYGWSCMKRKPAGNHHGRNCKEAWRTEWNGDGAKRLSQMIGGEWVEKRRRKTGDKPKWRIESGRVWLKIRKIETDEAAEVWDLEVKHSDHTFRTAWFAVGNTEVARWATGGEQDAGETLTAMRNTLPKKGFHLALEESTANGAQGAFYETCRTARWPDYATWWKQWETQWPLEEAEFGRELQFVFIFAAWYEDERHRDEISPEQEKRIRETLDEDEKALIARYGQDGPRGQRLGCEVDATVWEQLAWRRSIIRNVCTKGGAEEFKQEYPSNPSEAFRSSGSPALDVEGVLIMESMARHTSPTCGTITATMGARDSWASGNRGVWSGAARDQAVFERWEEPIEGCKYLVTVDPMSGAEQVTGTGEKDRHAVLVLRDGYTDTRGRYWPVKLVARIKAPCEWEDEALTRHVWLLALYYGEANIVVEANAGSAILKALNNDYHANVYQREELDKVTQRPTMKLGWWNDAASRRITISTLQQYVRQRMMDVCCPHVVAELLTLIIDKKGKAKASGSNHDDDALALAIGLECLPSAHKYPSELPVRRRDPNAGFYRPVG